ncbi:hypothetical protein OG735_05245 [Streptomyces sp. NBC_01210]|uniref:hypothetical protein n=1 Tax=Streptomyces sp. NBC_01210 TaxID=2903774 RepID=UPI002E138CBF|nr:hypothetical protein OG735_05245 [Streptomyces sp. NBC_01210]
MIDAGEPSAGLNKGMRIYFASDTGLRGVPRPDVEVRELSSVVKLLIGGPSEAEQQSGLSTLVESTGEYHATGTGNRVVLEAPELYLWPEERLLIGQLVCSLARAQSVLHPEMSPDDVQVTLKPRDEELGPYHCSPFLSG